MNGRTLRFINFLSDSAIFFAFLIIFLLIFKEVIAQENVKWISCVGYFLYYFISEYFMGQTLGKIITRSEMITLNDNRNYFFMRMVLRSMMRCIPLDVLSYLFTYRGLHDRISETTVIRLKTETV